MEPAYRIVAVIVLLVASLPLKAGTVPNDLPTIEALIDAHKKMKKAEDLAVLELTAIEETHSLTEKVTTAFNKTRTALNKRMSDANSYIALASQVTGVALKLKNLVENYADFTTLTYEHAVNNPLVMVYYVNANAKIKNEVKHVEALVAGFTASGLNLLKATMQEKYAALAKIENAIARINRIIGHASLMCRSMVNGGVKIWHVKDLLNDKTTETIAEKLIALWNENQSRQW